MKKILVCSVAINILLILFGGYIIYKKGGINYIKDFLFPQKHTEDSYYRMKRTIFDIMPKDSTDIVFLGNSITDFCDWHELFGKMNIKNRGINGDIISGVINRIDDITSAKPEQIFLMIGINDIGGRRGAGQILVDYEKLINQIIEKSPKTKLYIQSVLPTVNRNNMPNDEIIKVNDGLVELTKKYNLTYINLFDLFKTSDNKLNSELTFDGLHLNGKGYLIWKNAISQYIN